MRRLGLASLIVAGLGLLPLIGVHVASEWQLRDVPEVPAFATPIPVDPGAIERGRHVARTRGCFGCHGQRLEGQVFTDEWVWVVRAVAPNLARHAREFDAGVLERAIRHGIGHDGRAFWSMPSYNWVHLSDDDVAALIAYLRSAEVVEQQLPKGRLGWRARWLIATGREGHMVDWVEDVPSLLLDPASGDPLARGEYLAMTACNECHGFDLRGSNLEPDITPPDLAIVAAYSWEQFNRLMDEGVARDGREDLGLMTVVARDRFASLTTEERSDLYAFLTTLPQRPIPADVRWRSPG